MFPTEQTKNVIDISNLDGYETDTCENVSKRSIKVRKRTQKQPCVEVTVVPKLQQVDLFAKTELVKTEQSKVSKKVPFNEQTRIVAVVDAETLTKKQQILTNLHGLPIVKANSDLNAKITTFEEVFAGLCSQKTPVLKRVCNQIDEFHNALMIVNEIYGSMQNLALTTEEPQSQTKCSQETLLAIAMFFFSCVIFLMFAK